MEFILVRDFMMLSTSPLIGCHFTRSAAQKEAVQISNLICCLPQGITHKVPTAWIGTPTVFAGIVEKHARGRPRHIGQC